MLVRNQDLEPELVDRGVQLVDAAVDAERAGPEQLVLAVAAGEDADAEHPGSTGREEVPDRIADDVTVPDRDGEPFLAGEEEVGLWLGPEDVAAVDDDRVVRDTERIE
jgi:hypothetical protein